MTFDLDEVVVEASKGFLCYIVLLLYFSAIYYYNTWLHNRFPVTQGTVNSGYNNVDTERSCHSKSGSISQETDTHINKPMPFLNMRDNGRRHSQFYKYSSIGECSVSKQHGPKYSRNNINIDDSDKDIK